MGSKECIEINNFIENAHMPLVWLARAIQGPKKLRQKGRKQIPCVFASKMGQQHFYVVIKQRQIQVRAN